MHLFIQHLLWYHFHVNQIDLLLNIYKEDPAQFRQYHINSWWHGWFHLKFGIISFPVSLTLGCYNKPLSKIQFARSQVYTTTSKTHLKLRRSGAQCQGTEKMDQDRTSCIKFMHLGHLMHASAVKLFELALKK